jgi:hypothetical protein
MKLIPGDTIILDFDGIIVENINPTTKRPYYPKIGPIKEGAEFLIKGCNNNHVKILIWSARCNTPTETMPIHTIDYPIFGEMGRNQIYLFLFERDLWFPKIMSFLGINKPIGSHKGAAKFMLDDCCSNDWKEITF